MNQITTVSEATPNNGATANNNNNNNNNKGNGNDDTNNPNVHDSLSLLRKLSSIHIKNSSYEPPPPPTTTTSATIETIMGNHQSNSNSIQNNDYDVERGPRTSSSSSSTLLSSSSSSSSSSSPESNLYQYDPNKDYFFHDSKRSTTKPNKITNKIKQLQHSYTKPPKKKKKNNKKVSSSIDDLIYNHEEQQYYSLEELVDNDIYVVKQKVGYLALGYSLIQTIILIAMMMKCGIAPLNINRKCFL